MDTLEPQLNTQSNRADRKIEQARHDQNQARSAKLGALMRLVGIIVVIVGIIGGLIWIGENQDSKTTQPSPMRGAVSLVDHTLGPEMASLTLVEYSDFQCPSCAAFAPVIEQLINEYPTTLRFVYRHFPLQSIHPNANLAAQAAEAADMQGQFWAMHEILFDRQTDWSRLANPHDLFTSYASELGLKVEQFKIDIDSPSVRNRVSADYRSGLQAGVNSTPTFYLNGEPLENPRGLEAFKAVLDAKLN